MAIALEEIDDNGLGRASSNARFADAAIRAAQALAESDPS